MSMIIDRRPNGKNKSTVNRQRFMRRYRKHIKKAVGESIHQRSITDMDSGSDVTIPRKDLSEPVFHHGRGGIKHQVHPGNKEFSTGDRIRRPSSSGQGQGSGEGSASNQGEGMDEFTFRIHHDEFLDYMFDDLELPNMIEKQLKKATNFRYQQAGFTNNGTPEKLNIIRSLKSAHARRIALSGGNRDEIRQIKRNLREMEVQPEAPDKAQQDALKERLIVLNQQRKKLPFIDTIDLRYNSFIKVPLPSSQAVMFCIMDVSGSMTQSIKETAKKFFILLYLFLKRSYDNIEVVFIRHHTSAKEVDEEDFFYSRETGGTIVSSALELSQKIIQKRYPTSDWNIYMAQASDGDNWEGDSSVCKKILNKHLLDLVQYFAYVEITERNHQNLWREYESLATERSESFAMQQIISANDIYPVFRKLFARKIQ